MTVHHLEPRAGTVVGRFNSELAPVLTIDSGDSVVYRTLDSSWGYMGEKWFGVPKEDINRDPVVDTGHALVGPVAVIGASPGDVLEVEIVAIRPECWGWTWAGPMTHRERRYIFLQEEAEIGWALDADAGRATDIQGKGFSLQLRPFMGVMGNAPAKAGNHPTAPRRRVGGNLDCRELVADSVLWLPIEVNGALFSVGDGHGAQGDGEIGSTAIECPMEHVELTFRVRKDLILEAPRARTPAGIITFGLGDTLDDAATQAIAGMLDYLQSEFAVNRPEASILASLAVHVRVTQVVNETVGVHCLLPYDTVRLDRHIST